MHDSDAKCWVVREYETLEPIRKSVAQFSTGVTQIQEGNKQNKTIRYFESQSMVVNSFQVQW